MTSDVVVLEARDSERSPIFSRQFSLACLIYFASFILLHFLSPTLPLYVKSLGGRDSDIGIVLGMASIGALSSRFIAGALLDMRGRRWPMVAGALLYVLTMAMYGFTTTVSGLVPLRFLEGFGFGVVTTASSALAADLAPSQRRGEALGHYGNFASIAMAMAPGIAFWIIALQGLPVSGFPLLFWVCGGVALLMLLSSLKTRETRLGPPAPWANIRTIRPANLLSLRALPIVLAMFFGSYTLGAIATFVPIYLSTENVQNVPVYFLFYAAVMIASRPIVGRITDRFGRRIVALPLLLCCALGTSMFAMGPALHFALAASLVFGIGYGPLNATLMALVVDVVKPQERGAAVSTFMASVDLGIAAGALTLGLVADAYGYSPVFLAGGAVGMVGLAYFALYQRLSPSRIGSRPSAEEASAPMGGANRR